MTETVDVVLIGGGIMSATLGALLHELQPDWKITALERLSDVAEESSNAFNNAGTGHSALCELNYMPPSPDGTLDPTKAININEQFQQSRQFWSTLVDEGVLGEASSFINPAPHMTFVRKPSDIEYLRMRYETLRTHPLFEELEYSEERAEIGDWARRRGIDALYGLGEACAHAVAAFGAQGRHFADVEALDAAVLARLPEWGSVLVKGSRFMRMERVVQAIEAALAPAPNDNKEAGHGA